MERTLRTDAADMLAGAGPPWGWVLVFGIVTLLAGLRLPAHAPGYSPAAAVPTKGWATITALLQTAAGRPVAIEP